MQQTNHNHNTALATLADGGFNDRQVEIIRTQIAPEASDDQLALFLEVCRGTGLNPFMHQIHAVFRNAKDGDRWVKKMTIQTGIDGYRLLASRTGELAGIDDTVFDTEDAGHPNRASVTVWRFIRGQRIAFTATARWTEYVQTTKEGAPTSMWAKMPFLMLGKCAEALALRKAFPAELSGMYTGEEMAQAENDLPTPPRTPPTPEQPARPVVRSVVPAVAPVASIVPDFDPDNDETIPYSLDDSDMEEDLRNAASQAPAEWKYLQDRDFRLLLNRLGIRSVDAVETFVAESCANVGHPDRTEALAYANRLLAAQAPKATRGRGPHALGAVAARGETEHDLAELGAGLGRH